MGLVEDFNSLSDDDIINSYMRLRNNPIGQRFELLSDVENGRLSLSLPKQLSELDFNACFSIIESTSRDTYKASSVGWSASKKRKEMKLPDMRYLLLNVSGHVVAFLSFMVTFEDGIEVIYCYELHVDSNWRDRGIGKVLMDVMEGVGIAAGVKKAMLTVFMDNEGGRRFYRRHGYSFTKSFGRMVLTSGSRRYRTDDFSPTERVLRNGTVKQPSYIILSKMLKS
ncbi:MAG: hypothetical protein M1814_000144 [Vezdaea aestivalis]|nr:MAG: hypothetical protein M1814_000144 [Vezdaea aestivalis]